VERQNVQGAMPGNSYSGVLNGPPREMVSPVAFPEPEAFGPVTA